MGIISIELHEGQVPTEPGYYFVLHPQSNKPHLAVVEKSDGGGFGVEHGYYGLIIGCSKLDDTYVNSQWSDKIEFRATLKA